MFHKFITLCYCHYLSTKLTLWFYYYCCQFIMLDQLMLIFVNIEVAAVGRSSLGTLAPVFCLSFPEFLFRLFCRRCQLFEPFWSKHLAADSDLRYRLFGLWAAGSRRRWSASWLASHGLFCCHHCALFWCGDSGYLQSQRTCCSRHMDRCRCGRFLLLSFEDAFFAYF